MYHRRIIDDNLIKNGISRIWIIERNHLTANAN
jgi:hypothetical protein